MFDRGRKNKLILFVIGDEHLSKLQAHLTFRIYQHLITERTASHNGWLGQLSELRPD